MIYVTRELKAQVVLYTYAFDDEYLSHSCCKDMNANIILYRIYVTLCYIQLTLENFSERRRRTSRRRDIMKIVSGFVGYI